MAKKLVIDEDICIGCGSCAVLATKTFVMGDDGKAKVLNRTGDKPATIQEAIDSCPVTAITWEE